MDHMTKANMFHVWLPKWTHVSWFMHMLFLKLKNKYKIKKEEEDIFIDYLSSL